MKIKSIFIGDLNDYTESRSKHDAFRDIGWDITSWSTVPIPTYPGLGSSNSLLRRAARKILPMEDLTGANAWLSKMAKSGELGNFDVVWSDKAINVKPRILRRIKQQFPHVKLVFASGDNMTVPAFRNKAFLATLPLFDVVITMKSGTECDLEKLGARLAVYMPKSFDKHWVSLLRTRQPRYDVSFIGSYEYERSRSLIAVAESGLSVNVWGNGWGRLVNAQPNLIIHNKPVYYKEMIEKIEETKINLCFLRKLAQDKSTNRTFEIPACAGFMLAESTHEQRAFFPAGEAAEYFHTDAELVEKCHYFLANEERRIAVASRGHQLCLSSGYSYHARAQQFMNDVMPLIT